MSKKLLRHLTFCVAVCLATACGGSPTPTSGTPDPSLESATPAGTASADATPAGVSGLLPTPTPEPGVPVQNAVLSIAIGGNPDSFNPLLATNSAAATVNGLLFPVLVKRNPYTGQYGPDGAMAERWDVGQDGLTYTFYLRPGVTWSDGDPVNATDFKFTYDALVSEQVDSPHKALRDNIASIEALDALTVRVTFKTLRCDALNDLGLEWLPSHLYAPDFKDIMENQLNTNPSVSAGPYIFQSWAPGENVALRSNASFWQGEPQIQRLIFQIVADPADRLARLLSGDLDVAALQPYQLTSVQANTNLKVFGANIDGYDFIALNLANPENPLPGTDEAGNRVVQDPHPVLGDAIVRQAIASAIDYKTIIESIYLNRGYQIASNVLPVIPWAHDTTLEPYAYDPTAARQLLQDDGWTDTNNDGIREKETQSLALTIQYDAANKKYEQIADIVQDQLNSVGFDITLAPHESATVVQALLGQTYDMVVTGWTALGSDPNDDVFWASAHDRPGSDFNFVSYQNAAVDQLLAQGNTVPGCAPEDRAPIYKQIQQQLHADLPYIFLSGAVSDIGYNARLEGVQPAAWDFAWNLHQWYKTAPAQ